VVENVSGQDYGYFLHPVDREQQRSRVQTRIHDFPHAEGLSRDGQDRAGPGHVPHAGGSQIETEGNPEEKRIEVVGTSSEFSVDTFGKPKSVIIDPNRRVLRYSPQVRVAVAIRRGEQYAELSEFGEAIKEYQRALETNAPVHWRTTASPRSTSCRTIIRAPQRIPRGIGRRSRSEMEPKSGPTSISARSSTSADSASGAVSEYNLAIRTKDDTQGAQEEAGKYLKTPYERQRRVEQ